MPERARTRSISIEDSLWARAKYEAQLRGGIAASDVIRELLNKLPPAPPGFRVDAWTRVNVLEAVATRLLLVFYCAVLPTLVLVIGAGPA